jgi:hypothetical protein
LLSAALDGGTQIVRSLSFCLCTATDLPLLVFVQMVFIATFALFGGGGPAVVMPVYALNPDPVLYNLDYCMALN